MTGLDCVGLAAWALAAGGFRGAVPDGYAMRGGDPRAVSELLDESGLVRVDEAAPGDLLLCASGPGQLHLAIASESGVIHADAMLRRVVERPGAVLWPVLGCWRIRLSGD